MVKIGQHRPRQFPRQRREVLAGLKVVLQQGDLPFSSAPLKSAACLRCAAAAGRTPVPAEPLLKRSVHPSLPAWPISAKCRENLRIDPNSDLFFSGVLVLSTRLSQRADFAATPPPSVTTPWLQSIPSGGAGGVAAAFAAAIFFELKIFKIALDL